MNRRQDPSSCSPKVLKHGEEKSVLRPSRPTGKEPGHHSAVEYGRYVPATILRPAPRISLAQARVPLDTGVNGSKRMYSTRAFSAVLQGRRELVSTPSCL